MIVDKLDGLFTYTTTVAKSEITSCIIILFFEFYVHHVIIVREILVNLIKCSINVGYDLSFSFMYILSIYLSVLKWENIKRKQALRQYNKQLKKSGINFKDNEDRKVDRNTNFVGALKRAQLQFDKIKQEKERKRQEKELDRQQREAALKAYKEKKAMRNEKLFQKMRNGRVSMKGRLELMLEKIQKEYGNKEE